MDTFASSASTLKIHSLPRHSREYCHVRTTVNTAAPPSPPHIASTSKPRRISLTQSSTSTRSSLALPVLAQSQASSLPASYPVLHQKPATGYAAALVDIAQKNNSLHMVHRDVQRLLQLVKNVNMKSVLVNPSVGEGEKGQVMSQIIKSGKFHRYMEALLKMLVKKNKVDIVPEVLEEFERIYDELSGTQVVLVSAVKMREEQLIGIAKRVQKLSGAFRVKISNLFHKSLPSYAA